MINGANGDTIGSANLQDNYWLTLQGNSSLGTANGWLRLEALRLAISVGPPEFIMARAQAYLEFLSGMVSLPADKGDL